MKKIYFSNWIIAVMAIAFSMVITSVKAQTTVTIANGTYGTTQVPVDAPSEYSWSAQLYTASEFSGNQGFITSLAFNVSTFYGSSLTLNNQKIYMALVDDVVFTQPGYISPASVGATLVYDGSITYATTGWNTINLNIPFPYVNNKSLLLLYEHRGGTYSEMYPTFVMHEESTQMSKSASGYEGFPYNEGYYCYNNERSNVRFVINPFSSDDVAVNEIISPAPSQSIIPNNSFPITVELQNTGTSPQYDFTVRYSVDGGITYVSQLFTDTLNFLESANFTFNQTADFSVPNFYHLKVDVVVYGDNVIFNNEKAQYVLSCYPLSGTYTVGATVGNDFESLTQAVSVLNSCGISAPVTFILDSGTHLGSYHIGTIAGASAANTITIKSNTNTILSLSSNPAEQQPYIFLLDNAKHITIENLMIKAYPQNQFFSAIQLMNQADSNTFRNLMIELPSTYNVNGIVASPSVGQIHGEGNNANATLIENCYFSGGENSIYFNGAYDYKCINNQIINNVIVGAYQSAISVSSQSGCVVEGNQVSLLESANYYSTAVSITNSEGGTKFNNNNIQTLNSRTGIVLEYMSSQSSDSTIISNNMISMRTNGDGIGVNLYSSNYMNLYNNSIHLYGDEASNSNCIYFYYGDNLSFKNNILVNDAGGRVFYTNLTNTSYTNDYNLLYARDALGYFGTSDVYSLVQLQNTTGDGAHSLIGDPGFYSNTDLHISLATADGKGVSLAEVMYDIDGQFRNASTPDIGADEFTPPQNNIKILDITGTATDECSFTANELITVTFVNQGTANQNSIPIRIKLDNYNLVSETYNSNVSTNDTVSYQFSTAFDISQGGLHHIMVYTDLANDEIRENDTLQFDFETKISMTDFPYFEGFEASVSEIFTIRTNSESAVNINPDRGNASMASLEFEGGSSAGWNYTGYDFYQNITQNSSHEASISTCEFDGSALTGLMLTLDMKSEDYYGYNYNNWFWVTINDTIYPKTLTGDSAFMGGYDDFLNLEYDLSAYLSSGMSIQLHTLLKYNNSYGGYRTDIDNINIYEPQDIDVGIINVGVLYIEDCGSPLDSIFAQVKNFGLLPVINVPIAADISYGSDVYHYQVTVADTIQPSESRWVYLGQMNSRVNGLFSTSVYTTLSTDSISLNNTWAYQGYNEVYKEIPYIETFENNDNDWYKEGIETIEMQYFGGSGKALAYFADGGYQMPGNQNEQYSAFAYFEKPIGEIQNNSVLTLEVKFFQMQSFKDSILIVVSTDCGNSYETVLSINPGNYSSLQDWTNFQLPLAAYQGELLKIGVRIVENNNSSYMVAIDNFGIVTPTEIFLGNDTTICQGESLFLTTGLSASDGYSFKWVGPSIPNNAFGESISVSNAGVYYVEVTDNIGFKSYDSINVVVNAKPQVIASATENSICFGESALINMNFIGSSPFYVNLMEGSNSMLDTVSTTRLLNVSPIIDTKYIIKSITDANGCIAYDVDSVTIIVNPLPTVSASGLDAQYCQVDTSVVITASPIGGALTGSGISGSVFNPIFANQGTNKVFYSYTDANSCTNVDTLTTMVYAKPTVNFVSQIDSTYCANGQNVPLYVYPAGGTFSHSAITSNSFSPSQASMGLNSLIYSFTDAHNCSNSDTAYTTILPTPTVAISTTLNSQYCQNELAVALVATPTGGTFVGNGVDANSFDPSMALAGNVAIKYNYTNGNGCTNSDTIYTQVNATPSVSITSSLNADYCQDGSKIQLTAYPIAGTFSGSGVTGRFLYLDSAALGTNTIYYTYTNANNCTAMDSIVTTIHDLPAVSITSNLNSQYCKDAAAVTLAATPTGGTFVGNGVSSTTFNPANATAGSIAIRYNYTDVNGCANSDTIFTLVNSNPDVLITTNIQSSYCQDGSSVSLNGYPVGGAFTGNGITGNTFSPTSISTGLHYLKYSYTDNNGCSNADSVSTMVNPLPTVSHTALMDICANQNTLNLTGGTPAGGQYSGDFVNTNQAKFYANAAGTGVHLVDYTYTDANGCSNSVAKNIKVISTPQANFTMDPVACINDTVQLTFSGSSSALATYNWNFGTANTIVGTNQGPYKLVWDTSGVKQVSLMVTDSGCTSTNFSNYTNVIDAISVATVIGNSNVCFGDSVSLFANSGLNYSYQWFNSGGAITNASDTLSYFSVNQTGSYYVEVTNDYGCSDQSNLVSVNVNPLITSDFSLPALACKEDLVNIVYTGQSGGNAVFNWDFNQGVIASGSNAGPYNILWNTENLKTVSLVVSENSCSSNVTTHNINIVSTSANITAMGDTSFCEGGEVILSSNVGANSYVWYKNNMPISGATQATYTANSAGYYKVLVTNNTTQCGNFSDSIKVTVNTNDFNIAFTASPVNFTIPPFNTTFTNQTINKNNYYWMWSFGDGTTSTFVNPTHSYGYDDTFTVAVIAQNIATGCFDTLVKDNYIQCSGGGANPCSLVPDFKVTGGHFICPGDQVKFSAKDHTVGINYQWLRDGILIVGATDSVYYAQQTGLYQLMVSDLTCSMFSQPFSLSQRITVTPTILTNGNIQPCSNDSMELFVSTTFNAYQWSNGDSRANIYVHNSGSYIVTVTDNNGCRTPSQPLVVNASLLSSPEICIVGIDTATNHNQIVWERQSNALLDSFRVYRESSISGVYDLIGSMPFSTLSVFQDVNSDPAQRAYRYRITAVDTCGMETPPSPIHKTIHLSINAGLNNTWNLIWDGYQGFNFGSYRIYRGVDSTQMQLLTQIQSTLSSYTDLNPPAGNVYYQIEIMSPHPCYPDSIYTKANTNYNTSRSNTSSTMMAPNIGFEQVKSQGLSLQLYPNPSKGHFVMEIQTASYKANDTYNMEVYNVMGTLVYSDRIDVLNTYRQEMHFETLSKGVYFIRLTGKTNILTGRFIID